MGRAGRKFKGFMGRVGKGLKTGWRKFTKFVKGASDTYDRAKQYVSDHQADIDKAKDIARKYGGKYGGKAADAAEKAEGAYKKGTAYIDKQRDRAREIAHAVKS